MADQITCTQKRSAWNSALLGTYFTLPLLTKLLTFFITIENNFIIIAALILGMSLIVNHGLRVPPLFMGVGAVMTIAVLIFSLPMLRYEFSHTLYYILAFLVYGLGSMYLCAKPIEAHAVFRAILVVYAAFTVLLVVYYIPEALRVNYYEGSMDISYATLSGFSALLLYFPHARRKLTKLALVVMFLINGYYCFFLSNSRGAVLALILMLGLILLRHFRNKKYFPIYVCMFLVALVLLSLSFTALIEWLMDVAPDVRWVRRFIYADDVSTGRDSLYLQAWEMIKMHPIIGNGIGRFEYLHDGSYTHNVFLQLLVEFGLVIGGVAGVVLVWLSFKTVFAKKTDLLMIYLFSQFVPRLLVSSVYWENLFIWSFVYLGLQYMSREKGSEIADAA